MRGFTNLAKAIRDTVRTKAKEIPVFRETVNGEPSVKYDDFCGIYVCVSGAKSDEDYACALEAIQTIKDFFLEADGMWAFEYEEPEEGLE